MLRRRLYAEWLLVAILSCSFVVFATMQGWFVTVDNRIYDIASGLTDAPADDRILIVEIDNSSLQQLGRWPWPRSEHVRAVEAFAQYRPAAVAYDVLFLDSGEYDEELADALSNFGPFFVPSYIEAEAGGRLRLERPVEPIAGQVTKVGVAQLLPDNDGIVRRAERYLTINGETFGQLPTLLAEQGDPAVARHKPADERFLINYAGATAFRRVPFASLANGEVPADLVEGKLLLVGATAPGLGDTHSVPVSAGALLSGVELQANILNTLLSAGAIKELRPPVMAVVAVLPLILLLLAYLRLSPARNLMLASALLIGFFLLAVLLLPLAQFWLPPSATVLGLLLLHALWGWRRLAAVNGFLVEEADRLLNEPEIMVQPDPKTGEGDVIASEAMRLQSVIDQVRDMRQFVSSVVESLPDAIFVVDGTNRVVLSNGPANQLYGSNALGEPLQVVNEKIGRDMTDADMIVRHPEGRIMLTADSDIEDGRRIVTLTDITEIQRAADEREDLLQFLSHDLRSPNAAIVWLLETESMEGDSEATPPIEEGLRDKIQAHARHSLQLADDFVQLVRARRRPLTSGVVDLCDVALEASDMVSTFAEKRWTRLEKDSDRGELWVMGDRAMLVRAIVNLLDNAVKFAPKAATVRYGVKRDGDDVVFSVSGPGPAMPPERQDNPFAVYAKGRDAAGRGSIGLGLAFVQTVVQRHQGEVTYRYQDGFGAEFEIRLPLADTDEEADL